jgi:hypothetical protein
MVFVSTVCLADIQSDRARWIGPEVGRGATFTIHVVGAEKSGSSYKCPAAFRPGGSGQSLSQAEMDVILAKQTAWIQERLPALNAPYDKQIADLQKQSNELPRRVNRNELPREQGIKELNSLHERMKALQAQQREAQIALATEAQSVFPVGAQQAFVINVQHAPRDPKATIVPLANDTPTPQFDAELNTAVKPFLATCGHVGALAVQHFFRDAQRLGESGTTERPVLAYRYTVSRGELVLERAPTVAGNPFSVSHAQDITLEGFLALNGRVAQARGDYRNDYRYASRRKPGIVYKYDAFWAQFDFEIARRIFEGQFKPYDGTIDFAFLYTNYGALFTKQCRAQVKEMKTLYYETRDYVGGETTPDLTFEPKYETNYHTAEIDARFAPRINEYTGDQMRYMWKVWAERVKRGEKFEFSFDGMRKATGEQGRVTQLTPAQQFFAKVPCTSATMQQLGENLYRAASKMPSAQDAGVRFAGAAAESDPATQP